MAVAALTAGDDDSRGSIGVWERINIGVFLLWVVALSTAPLRARDAAAGTGRTPVAG
ncbi:MAG: hypothetical protein ABJA98_02820 [Acidobacteriota bacterium]